jgi:hypothetical protein
MFQKWRRNQPSNPVWLLALPAVICLTDLTVTLAGQTAAYWQGYYADVIEENPIGWVFLQLHPSVFAGAVLVWMACFTAFIRWAPRLWAAYAALGVIIGHTFGTCSWLPRLFGWGVGIALGTAFCLAIAALALPTWHARQPAVPGTQFARKAPRRSGEEPGFLGKPGF